LPLTAGKRTIIIAIFRGKKFKNQQRFLIRILSRDLAPLNCTEVKLLINLGKENIDEAKKRKESLSSLTAKVINRRKLFQK
jgi:hypothetical protein